MIPEGQGLIQLKPLEEYKREDFDVTEGTWPSILVNNRRELTKYEKLLALRLLRERIAAENLDTYDCDEHGCKDTWCNWGLCKSEGLYPHPESHTWPMSFIKEDRSAPIGVQVCPMDKDQESNRWGCFYRCRIFQAKMSDKPTREEALTLVDTAIEIMEKKLET